MRRTVFELILLIAIAIVIAGLLVLFGPRPVHAVCRPAPDAEQHPDWYPTNCVGDVAYGRGQASGWSGPGVARNDCLYPWDSCTPIRITYQGRSVVVTPTMYCDCWRGLEPGTTGPLGERPRLVDLDPSTRAALGMRGFRIWNVTVYPAAGERSRMRGVDAKTPSPDSIPDTALSTR